MAEKYGRKCKTYMMDELRKKVESSPSFIVTNYKGLGVVQIQKLKKELKKVSSGYFVVKNSIAKRVFDEAGIRGIQSSIEGQVGISFVGEDAVAASKALVDFSKANTSFKIKQGFIDGSVQGLDKIKQLAALPPRDVLLAMVISHMKSPITGFVGVLKGLLRNFVHVIDEIRNKKGGSQ